MSDDPEDKAGRVEYAFQCAHKAKAAETRMKRLRKDGKLTSPLEADRITEALEKELISPEEAERLTQSREAMLNAIRVDAFQPDDLFRKP